MTTPILFTHSFATGKGAVINPAAAYIKGARVFQGKGFSEVHRDDNGDRFVFSFWLSIQADQLVAVMPSDEMVDAWKRSHGGALTALMPQIKPCDQIIGVMASMRDNTGFSWQAVAGLVGKDDIIDHLVILLGEEHRAAIVDSFNLKSRR